MARVLIATAAALLFTACGGETPAKPEAAAPVEPTPAAAAPDPTSLTPPAAEAENPAATSLVCGGATFRVAFDASRAIVYNDDGTQTELPLLAADANAAPAVNSYTDGKMTFAKSDAGGTASTIRFARGRMAFEDCSIAQN